MDKDPFWSIRLHLRSIRLRTEITRNELVEMGAGDSTIQRLRRWGLLIHKGRGVFEVGDEDNPEPKVERKAWPGEAEWRRRGIETRRANNFQHSETQWLETAKWFRKYHGTPGTQFTAKELKNMSLSYPMIQRLVRNGFIKPVRRGLYEVL